LIAWNLLSTIHLLTGAATALGSKAIAGFTVHEDRLKELAARNAILATALAPRIGYDQSAEIAKEVARSGRSVLEVAREKTSLGEPELLELLDPAKMTR
jgi:fumarate hydratase class II